MFILASSVCQSLQYPASTLTQGDKGGHLFRLTCSVVLWEGRNTASKYHWRVWEVLAVSGPHGVCLYSRHVCFPGLHCSGSRLLCKVGPGLCALPRSEPLRFSFLGTPQKHRLGWACVLRPSQVRATEETRCLASTHSPGGAVRLITFPIPAARFPGCAAGAPSQVCHVSPLGS